MVDTRVQGVHFNVLSASQLSRELSGVYMPYMKEKLLFLFKLYKKYPVYCGFRGYDLHIYDLFDRCSY